MQTIKGKFVQNFCLPLLYYEHMKTLNQITSSQQYTYQRSDKPCREKKNKSQWLEAKKTDKFISDIKTNTFLNMEEKQPLE